jgi:hypothetical protein
VPLNVASASGTVQRGTGVPYKPRDTVVGRNRRDIGQALVELEHAAEGDAA